MIAKSFISHTENGGTGPGKTIQDQLIHTELEMETFLSQNSIKGGDHIPQKILEFLLETDVLFVIFEPLVRKSRWVRWEYEFCKNRHIRIIPVVVGEFSNVIGKEIDWIESNDKYLLYDFRDEKLRYDAWRAITNIKDELEQRATERVRTVLEADVNNAFCFEQDTVKISGKVENALTGRACMYIPSLRDDYPPIITNVIDTPVIPDDKGKFELEFKLPPSPIAMLSPQKWFIEIKFGKKSKLISISVNRRDDNRRDFIGNLPDDSNVLESSKNDGKNYQAIKKKIETLSEGNVQSIPRRIKEKTICRDDKVSEIVNMLNDNDRVVVMGDRGSGKSVLMCQLYERLKGQRTVLFLRCDDYLGVESFKRLNDDIIPGSNFIDLVQKIATESDKLTIILDSLDAISRNEKSMNIFKLFLKNIWGTGIVQTILSVRTYDYEYSPSINTTYWGTKYELGSLNAEEIDAALVELGNPRIPDELKNILGNLLHLKLLSLILETSPGADFSDIKNEIELYDKHWNEYVEKSASPSEIRSTLYDIAQKMVSLQRITIPYDEFNNPSAMSQILSSSIILRGGSGDMINFFHHAYLDYAVSRFILAKHSGFVDYLQEDEYNVFLRPTIVFALSILNKRDPKSTIMVIESILGSQLRYFWKISALTALARVERDNDQNFTGLGNFLTKNTVLQRHFLIEVQKHQNVFWFDLWNDSFFVEWLSDKNNSNSGFVMDYLKSITGLANHQHVFRLLQLLVANSDHPVTKRRAVELSAEVNAEGKASWLCELSSSKDPAIRDGVVGTLSKLVESDPKVIPDIFCSLFTYDETSDEQTTIGTYGTLGMTSTKRQDNNMVIWRAGELFPELLWKNPCQMLIAAIRIFEILRKAELDKYEGSVIEDHAYIWFAGSAVSYARSEDKLLHSIISYLKDCSEEKIAELIPVFQSTRLAIFHSILLDALVQRKNLFVDKIFQLVSNPQVYKILTMKKSVRIAIKEICQSLRKDQVEKLLHTVMNIRLRKALNEDKILNKIKAEFLSEFSEDLLQTQHLKILDSYSEPDLEYRPALQYKFEIGNALKDVIHTDIKPEVVITNSLNKELEHNQKIDLLENISKYLGGKAEEVDETKLPSIKKFLVKSKDDPDPQDNAEDGDGSFPPHHLTIRGLAAGCLVQLLYHSKDETLVPMIKELSDDPINTVREEICKALRYLFHYDYDLTYSITKQYSQDSDLRTLYFLFDVLRFILHKNTKHATLIVTNMLNTLPTNYRQIQGVEDFLIYLAFHKKENGAINLLNKIVDDKTFSPEIRSNIPFVLKENYLFKDVFQDKSLDLLYRLLDDPDHQVREKAAFFTLHSFEKDETVNNDKFVEKIEGHLDKIVLEVDMAGKQSWDARLIEHLVRFLGKFWYVLHEKTIYYLEKITDEKIVEYAAYQPVWADASVKILTGLFQHPDLSKKNRKRCLSILDKYAMAGWPKALQLLSAMERPN